MALINRISRLVKADFHAVLDQIEEPELLLRQAIREMDDQLAVAEQRIARCAEEQEALVDREKELEAELSASEAQLDLCFESKNDELARKLIRRKLYAERHLKQLRSTQKATAKSLVDQRTALADNRTTLQSLQQKAALFAHRAPNGLRTASGIAGYPGGPDTAISDDDVEIAFLGELNRRAQS